MESGVIETVHCTHKCTKLTKRQINLHKFSRDPSYPTKVPAS